LTVVLTVAPVGHAAADEPPGGNAPHDVVGRSSLRPPRAVAAGPVPYPDGGAGESVVVIELVVGASGEVEAVRLVSGPAPFAEAALEAAWRFRFDPARRGDDAVAARIRMRVEFTPPRVVRPAASALAPAQDTTDVRVRGHHADPGETTLGGGEVRQIPGAFGDAFRAIDALPGVVPMASGLPYYFVRGAPPGDTGFFVDDVRVPLLFHAAFGPSVIHPSLVDHVDFFPGTAPAEYGHFAGGILTAAVPEPSSVAHGEAEVRLFDAGALAETPFADDRGTALAAGRYSYSGAIVSAISPIKVAYWDYQARATWNLDDKSRLGLFAFGSYDDFQQVVSGVTDTILDGTFHRIDLRYDRLLSRGTLRVASTFGYARSNNDYSDIRELTAGVRAALDERITETTTLRAGGDLTFDRYDLVGETLPNLAIDEETSVLYPPHLDTAVGAYGEVATRLAPRIEGVLGVRADLFVSHRYDDLSAELQSIGLPGPAVTTSVLPALSPRLSTRVTLMPNMDLLSTVSIAEQPAAFVVPIPGLTFVEPDPTLQTAFQMSQGVSMKLPWDIALQTTGFLHEYVGLSDLTATCPSIFGSGILLGNAPSVENDVCLARAVRGQAFGDELALRRKMGKRLGFVLSYTLSRSTREAPIASPGGQLQTVTMLSSFDRTHVVSLVGSYDIGWGVHAGARLVAYTGLPYTPTRDYVPVPPYNGARMPAFYRVDVKVEKRWRVSERVSLAVVLEGMNVTLQKEALGAHCAPAPGQAAGSLDACTFQTLGPVSVPSLGIEGWF
jgi:TonB family protein